MFNQNGHKSFYRTQDGSVNDNWAFEARFEGLLLPDELFIVHIVGFKNLAAKLVIMSLLFFEFRSMSLFISSSLCLVLQVEANWELEIALDSTALVGSLHSIENFDVDLWTIESAISSVDLPWFSAFVKSIFKCFLGLVPLCIRAKTDFRSGRELEIKSETENSVHMLKKI